MIVTLRWSASRSVGQRKDRNDLCTGHTQRIHATAHRRAGSDDVIDENHRRTLQIDM